MKTVVITGSTRGIGNGLAREFLRRGCNVVVSGRSAGSVQGALSTLGQFGQRVHGVPCEVHKYEQVLALWDESTTRFGKVDIWITKCWRTTKTARLSSG